MNALEEQIHNIIDFSEFDDLPDEQKSYIRKFMREQKINDYWSIVTKYDKYIPEVFRKILITAIRVMVASYQKDYK